MTSTAPTAVAPTTPLRRPAPSQIRLPLLGVASRLFNTVRLAGQREHQRRVRESRRVLATLRTFHGSDAPARVFSYLRKIDPFVFEEVVLSALEDAGAFVIRNRRYTGDGGVDGRCWLPWAGLRTIAVQAKRYDAAVTPSQVQHFCHLVKDRRHASGFFVHCGRTGPLTYEALRGQPVQLLSGARMLGLLLRGFI